MDSNGAVGIVRAPLSAATVAPSTGGSSSVIEYGIETLYVWDSTRAQYPTRRWSVAQAGPDAGQFARCGSILCVRMAEVSEGVARLAATGVGLGQMLLLKDCRLGDAQRGR
jgi:hypothetical protein